jgi:hypothetical protein
MLPAKAARDWFKARTRLAVFGSAKDRGLTLNVAGYRSS